MKVLIGVSAGKLCISYTFP